MTEYIIDLALLTVLIIGITAINGVLTNGIGEKVFGGKGGSDIYNRDLNVKTGWKQVGGKKKK
ncbi:hypothetical protein [Fredinandcohnia quinoae]|uniref:Uncharacterized protein n=1 Tax=Fredinandcohnia quinoae TaxID=2918902 RepID=A0AAW5E5U5_9BACI|nr:hypothetical protein [Fredinandcohnia sp. SECRCQ15]MCH1626224.1 hypothetical protein [Fredinandcohnia sp. SECRCQ15]